MTSLESMDELPAHPWEIEEALDEGVIANCSWGPNSVLVEDGKVVGMRLQSCLSVFDAQGRFAPQFAEEFTDMPADVIVFAIGQAPKLAGVVAGSDLLLTERGLLPVDGALMTTHMRGVFACGEVVTGPGSAIASIATGHEAATSIHRYLTGESLSEGRVYRPVPVYPRYEKASVEGVENSRRRVKLPMAKGAERAKDFRQVELGLHAPRGARRGRALPALLLRRLRRVHVLRADLSRLRDPGRARRRPGRALRDPLRPRPLEVLLLRPVRRAVPDGRAQAHRPVRAVVLLPRPHAVRQGRDGPLGRGQPSDRCRHAEGRCRRAACVPAAGVTR